jgi:hypothetical protein
LAKRERDEGHREFSKKMHMAIGIFVQLVVWQVRIKLSPAFSTKNPGQKRSHFFFGTFYLCVVQGLRHHKF